MPPGRATVPYPRDRSARTRLLCLWNPRARIGDPDADVIPSRKAATRISPPSGVCLIALSSRFARTWINWV